MAKSPSSPPSQEPERGRSSERGGDRDHEKRRRRDHERRESPGERQIFMDMVQRRLGGGAPPSAGAYAKAMQQWQQLPGAVVFVATPAIPVDDSQMPNPDSKPVGPPGSGTPEDEGRDR
jgi:hypothetical protein